MALTLTVDRALWRAHVRGVIDAFPGLVPVVKGNGYGFGRTYLDEALDTWAGWPGLDELAVGTVHELAGLPPGGPRPVVLTPTLAREVGPGVGPAILTVGSARHIAELVAVGAWPPVVVKLMSPMRRYGVEAADLDAFLGAVQAAGLPVHGFGVHLPLAGSQDDHLESAAAWARHLPPGSTVYVSHLDAPTYATLLARHPEHRWRIRLGTALWHGDKSALHLEADVVDSRPVAAGSRAGYRLTTVPGDGHLVMVSAGSAHGVQPLPGREPGGTSPFHFARRRLPLVEPPHMHTSMLFVPEGDPVPAVGDQVDVQHPLTCTLVDRIVER